MLTTKRWLMLGLSLGLVACGGPPEPNGKNGVLHFMLETGLPVAEGFESSLELPSTVKLGGGKSLTPEATYEFDFTNSQLEAEAPAAITVLERKLTASGYEVFYRCEPGSEGTHELRVRVKGPSGEVRYEDAHDLECARAAMLAVAYVDASDTLTEPTTLFLTGVSVAARVEPQREGGLPLGGKGPVELLSPQGVARLSEGVSTLNLSDLQPVPIETLQAGPGPTVRLAGKEVTLPMEVVSDSSVRVEVVGAYSQSSNNWSFSAHALHLASGQKVGGLQGCTFEVRSGTDVSTLQESSCYFIHQGATAPDSVCATARGLPQQCITPTR